MKIGKDVGRNNKVSLLPKMTDEEKAQILAEMRARKQLEEGQRSKFPKEIKDTRIPGEIVEERRGFAPDVYEGFEEQRTPQRKPKK
jgi:hypothetical protein